MCKGQLNYVHSAIEYNTAFGDYKLSIIAEKLLEITDAQNKKILEIAGGTGGLIVRYAKDADIAVLSDVDTNAIFKAKSKINRYNNIHISYADALSLPFRCDTFDVVIERNIPLLYLESKLYDGTALKVIEEMKRVSNNRVIIIHENRSLLNRYILFNQKLKFRRTKNIRYFTGGELKDLLKIAGLLDTDIKYITHSSSFMFNLLGLKKTRQIEVTLQNLPFLQKLGGGIIAFGSKY